MKYTTTTTTALCLALLALTACDLDAEAPTSDRPASRFGDYEAVTVSEGLVELSGPQSAIVAVLDTGERGDAEATVELLDHPEGSPSTFTVEIGEAPEPEDLHQLVFEMWWSANHVPSAPEHTHSDELSAQPNPQYASTPYGWIDAIYGYTPQESSSCPASWTRKVGGWAYDPDKPSQSIWVHFYVSQWGSTSQVYVGAAKANKPRPDVDAAHGIGPNHGYGFTLPEWADADDVGPGQIGAANSGLLYGVRAYGININANGAVVGSGNVPLNTHDPDQINYFGALIHAGNFILCV